MNKDYRDNPGISNSILGWLNISPAYYKAYKEGKFVPKETSSMEFGSAFHTLVLQNEEFNKEYTVLKGKSPSSAQQIAFCKEMAYINAEDWQDCMVDVYKNYYICDKKTPAKISKEATTLFNSCSDYIAFLKEAEDKKTLSIEDYTKALECYESISNHKRAASLLLKNVNNKYVETKTETPIYFTLKGLSFKALPDRVIVNHKDHKVTLMDLKTTSGYLKDFNKSFKKYHYDRQLAFYHFALCQQTPELELYEWEYLMPVIETTGLHECSVFNISQDIIDFGRLKYENLLEKLFECETIGYDYPEEYYAGNGVVELDLEETLEEEEIGKL